MRSHDEKTRVARVLAGPGDPQTRHVSLSARVSLLGRGTRGGHVHKLQSWGKFLKFSAEDFPLIVTDLVSCVLIPRRLNKVVNTCFRTTNTWHHCSLILTFTFSLCFPKFSDCPDDSEPRAADPHSPAQQDLTNRLRIISVPSRASPSWSQSQWPRNCPGSRFRTRRSFFKFRLLD